MKPVFRASFMTGLRMRLHDALLRFRKGTEGVIAVEMIIILPALFWMIATSLELYDIHRHKTARVKATYTVADMLSREMIQADTALLNTAKVIFDQQTADNSESQLRMSVVRFRGETETYEVVWSQLRGDGPMAPLLTAEIANAHDELPVLTGGQELIIVESASVYRPLVRFPGVTKSYNVTTRVFSGIRFLPQLCFECQTS